MLACLAAYLALAQSSIVLATLNGNVSPFWPATGLAVWMFMEFGWGMWPVIVVGQCITSIHSGLPPGVALGMAGSDVLEAMLGSLLWWQIRTHLQDRLGQQSSPLCTVTAAFAAPVVAASGGALSLHIGGVSTMEQSLRIWTTWWTGDALGVLFVLPILLSGPRLIAFVRGISRADTLRCGAVALAAAAVCAATFLFPRAPAVTFGIYPVILLASLWIEAPVASLVALLMAVAETAATYLGRGPFVTGNTNQDLISMQVFLVAAALMGQVLPMFRGRGNLLPALILLIGWSMSGFVFEGMLKNCSRIDESSFDTLVSNASHDIEDRFTSVLRAMGSCRSLLLVSPDIGRDQWEEYVGSLNLGLNYPGIHSLSIVYPVASGGEAAFEERMHKGGAPDFVIRPIPGRDGPDSGEKFVAAYVMPALGNEASEGLDLASDSSRWSAAELARETGRPQVSGRVPLLHDPQGRSAFELFEPVYRPGVPRQTLSERTSALSAWIGAQMVASDFLDGVIRSRATELDFCVFEQGPLDRAHLVYSNRPIGSTIPSFKRTRTIKLASKAFTIGWNVGPDFRFASVSAAVWSALGLSLGTFLAASLVGNLQSFRKHAEELAEERTLALREEMRRRESIDQTLRDVSSFQHAILESAGMAIISTTMEGTIRTANGAAQRMLGYTEAELSGTKTPYVFHDPVEVAERALQFSAELGCPVGCGFEVLTAKARRDLPNEHEWTYVRKDGTTLPVQLSITAIRDNADQFIGFLCIAADVSERRKTLRQIRAAQQASEAALFELELQRDALDEHAIVSITDARGHINYVNARFCDLSGYSPLELIGQRHNVVNSGVHGTEFWSSFWQTITRGKVWRGEVCNRHKNGTLYWVDSTVVPFRNREGVVDRFVAIRTDITARKAHEAELSSARVTAESASKAKSEFLAVMSHEIRTPLNAVIGFTELLIDTPLQPQQLEFVETIRSSSESLITLINDILDFSKIEAGKLDIESTRIDGIRAAEMVANTFMLQAKSRGLWLTVAVSAELPSVIECDPSRFRQVLINLISNALKFTAQGGVTIEIGEAQDAPAPSLRFSVRDTGIGIPPEKQELLFQKFTQADSSITRRFGGTGLGLAICKRLIELMGGRVGLKSAPAEGSTFWFEIPLSRDQTAVETRKPSALRAAPQANAPSAKARTILVADDNRLNQRLVRLFLSKLGYESVVANNGAEALNLVQTRTFDLVLMDHQMPVMDGCEASRAIRAWEAEKGHSSRIPIIALTANATANGEAFYRAAGMDAYLTKPLLLPALARAMNTALCLPSPAAAEANPEPPPPAPPETSPVMNHAAALAQSGFDRELLAILAETFCGQADELLRALKGAAETRNLTALRQQSHKIKGSVGCFAADALRAAAQELEDTQEGADWGLIRGRISRVESDINRLRAELSALAPAPARA